MNNKRNGVEEEPLMIWTIEDITNYFYKQSDFIYSHGAFWRLAVSFFRKQTNCFKVDINIINSPFDIKKAKEYFKKHEFGVPANLDI